MLKQKRRLKAAKPPTRQFNTVPSTEHSARHHTKKIYKKKNISNLKLNEKINKLEIEIKFM